MKGKEAEESVGGTKYHLVLFECSGRLKLRHCHTTCSKDVIVLEDADAKLCDGHAPVHCLWHAHIQINQSYSCSYLHRHSEWMDRLSARHSRVS